METGREGDEDDTLDVCSWLRGRCAVADEVEEEADDDGGDDGEERSEVLWM